jgi:diguanylate cyclase (GGDEF)-like protein
MNSSVVEPTLVATIYSVGMILAISGLGTIIFSIRRQINRDSLIQGLIITVGFFSLIWLIQVQPHLNRPEGVFVWLTEIGLPFGLVVAIAICCIPLSTPTGRMPSFRLTFLASLLYVLGAFLQSVDTAVWATSFSNSRPSELLYSSDLCYALAYLTLASAFLHPSIRMFTQPLSQLERSSRDENFLLSTSFFLTPTAFLIQTISHKPVDAVFVVISSCSIFFLVMLRLASLYKMIFLQNQQLNLQKQELHDMAFHDKLTSLPNRTFLDDYLEQALSHVQPGQMGAALMIDLNRFKAINDTFGHHVGDEVLREITRLLIENKRQEDVVGRWGGDEFLFILKELTGPEDALGFARRLNNQVSASRFDNDIEYKVTLSIGICMFPCENNDPLTIVKYADHALYAAKVNELNPVILFSKDGDSR